jgi:hypothetical protein
MYLYISCFGALVIGQCGSSGQDFSYCFGYTYLDLPILPRWVGKPKWGNTFMVPT